MLQQYSNDRRKCEYFNYCLEWEQVSKVCWPAAVQAPPCLTRLPELGETFLQLLKHLRVLWKRPHIVCHELLLISFPLLAVAEVVCWATLIPIGQRALQRERRDWIEKRETEGRAVRQGAKGRCVCVKAQRRGEDEGRKDRGVERKGARAVREEEGDNEVRGTA